MRRLVIALAAVLYMGSVWACAYQVVATQQAKKDIDLLDQDHLEDKFKQLLNLVKRDPWSKDEPYEVLKGNLKGYVSRRLNDKHRFVYLVNQRERVVIVYSARGHYDD